MLQKNEITTYLHELNQELMRLDVKGEICLYGGAVMCVVYDARPSTKDVDAVFRPVKEIREAIKRVASQHGLREDWINDAVKGFVVEHPQRVFLDLSHLKVYVPEPDYLLAMKAFSARVDATDKEDVMYLIGLLNLKSPEDVFSIIEHYYPRQRIKPATQFFVEELFQDADASRVEGDNSEGSR